MVRDLSDILHGRMTMMPPSCCRVAADNSGCCHSYYVRVSEDLMARFPVEKAECCEGTARLITKPLSVLEMHSLAADIRKEGGSLFFAAIEE